MYLPSKIKPKYIGLFVLFLFLLFLPFKDLVEYIFVFSPRKLIIAPKDYTAQIEQLQKENLNLLLKNQELEYLKEDSEKLRQALQFKEKKKVNLIGAEVISFDPSTWRRIVTINAGINQKVREGAFAINEKGWLIGKIIEVKENHSRLMLINDPDFSLVVFVGKNLSGLLKGGLGGVKILYIEGQEKIKVKDKVWIKIPSLSFPLDIGEVKKVRKDENSLFWDVEVKLFPEEPLLHKTFIIE